MQHQITNAHIARSTWIQQLSLSVLLKVDIYVQHAYHSNKSNILVYFRNHLHVQQFLLKSFQPLDPNSDYDCAPLLIVRG